MVVVAVLISVTVLVVVAVVVEFNYYSNGSSGPWVFLLLLISCFLGVFFNTSALCRVPFLKKSVKTKEKIHSFNVHALDCIELVDFQCTAMYWTALFPLLCTTMHCTG